MAKKPHETAHLRLRLPEALRRQLANEAEKANRSLNSEILYRLGQTLSPEWRKFIAGMEEIERREQEYMEQAMQDPKVQETLRKIILEMRLKDGSQVKDHPERPVRLKDRDDA